MSTTRKSTEDQSGYEERKPKPETAKEILDFIAAEIDNQPDPPLENESTWRLMDRFGLTHEEATAAFFDYEDFVLGR